MFDPTFAPTSRRAWISSYRRFNDNMTKILNEMNDWEKFDNLYHPRKAGKLLDLRIEFGRIHETFRDFMDCMKERQPDLFAEVCADADAVYAQGVN